MRKNSPRKWLHACLDLLPVILIPVFMIYSHRHTIDSGSIQVPQNEVVDFNQLIDVRGYDNYVVGGFSFTSVNSYTVDVNDVARGYVSLPFNSVELVNSHKYLFLGDFQSIYYLSNIDNSTITYFVQGEIQTFNGSNNGHFSLEGPVNEPSVLHFSVYDLTQIFGTGSEPSTQQFVLYYPQLYYDYTLSHKELLKNTSTITYDDTDIMSQMTYQLYNSVDKYFNMGNVFGLGGIYDWFNLNIFNGNAPISIYIVWNIVLYEFVMDLLFLLYGLFMWFIDMVEHIMDKPFKSIK